MLHPAASSIAAIRSLLRPSRRCAGGHPESDLPRRRRRHRCRSPCSTETASRNSSAIYALRPGNCAKKRTSKPRAKSAEATPVNLPRAGLNRTRHPARAMLHPAASSIATARSLPLTLRERPTRSIDNHRVSVHLGAAPETSRERSSTTTPKASRKKRRSKPCESSAGRLESHRTPRPDRVSPERGPARAILHPAASSIAAIRSLLRPSRRCAGGHPESDLPQPRRRHRHRAKSAEATPTSLPRAGLNRTRHPARAMLHPAASSIAAARAIHSP